MRTFSGAELIVSGTSTFLEVNNQVDKTTLNRPADVAAAALIAFLGTK
jgi:hypothetical protein